jgi:hypothetical protein
MLMLGSFLLLQKLREHGLCTDALHHVLSETLTVFGIFTVHCTVPYGPLSIYILLSSSTLHMLFYVP